MNDEILTEGTFVVDRCSYYLFHKKRRRNEVNNKTGGIHEKMRRDEKGRWEQV